LDLVLNGGLEPGAVVVVAGAPGTGKTILAQQMCFAIGTAEHKCVYYTTVSEPHTKLVRHLEQAFRPGHYALRRGLRRDRHPRPPARQGPARRLPPARGPEAPIRLGEGGVAGGSLPT
jgi:hypothetical protein